MKAAIAQVQAMAKSYPKYSFYTCDIDDAPLAAYDAEVGTTTSRCVLKRVETPIFMALVVPKVLINHGICFFCFSLNRNNIFRRTPRTMFNWTHTYIYVYVYICVYIYIYMYILYIHTVHTHIHTCIISIIFHTSYHHMISSYIFHDISPLNYHDISTWDRVFGGDGGAQCGDPTLRAEAWWPGPWTEPTNWWRLMDDGCWSKGYHQFLVNQHPSSIIQ